MQDLTSAFSSIKALRNIAADQLETDPVRACIMSLEACEQMLEFCALNEVTISMESPSVQAALHGFINMSQGGETVRRILKEQIEPDEVELMAIDLLSIMDVLFESVQRSLMAA